MKTRTYKRMLCCILALVMLLSTLPALNISAVEVEVAESSADAPITEVEADKPVAEVSGTTADGWEYRLTDGKATITGSNLFAAESVELPSVIEDCPVTTIEDIGDVWAYCIKIPNTVTRIEEDAFSETPILKEITVPSSVMYLGRYAFSNCEHLETVTIESGLSRIEESLFMGCTSLISVSIPTSVTSIGDYAFEGCTSLESITIPSSVTDIGVCLFSECYSLNSITVDKNNAVYDSRDNCNAIINTATKSLIYGCKNTIIPKGVLIIGRNAFSNCTELKSITIPDGVEIIDSYAFSGCVSLDGIVIPKSCTILGYSAFDGCTSLKSVDMSKASLTYMGNDVFRGCTELESLTIPEGVTEIFSGSFMYCGKLKSISIPSTVTSIENSAFYDCDSLEKIIVSEDNPKYDSRDNCNAIIATSNDILLIGCNGTVIPSSVKEIGYGAFIGGDLFTKISIPSGVEKISARAFWNCSVLASVEIPKTVTSIGNEAFIDTAYYNDEKNWDEGVLYIGSALIEAKDELSGAYKIKEGTTVVAVSAFDRCDGLESIIIPDSIIALPSSLFSYCDSLAEIKVSENNTVYDSRNDCNAVIETKENNLVAGCKKTVIPSDIESIGYGAFNGCSELVSITIPSSVSKIDMNAFYRCKNLTSVTIEEGLTIIDGWVFENCSLLENIFIPSSVTDISWSAFNGCSDTLTIHGYTGSYAETYAKENGINFNSTGEVPSDDPTALYDMNVYSDRSGMNVQVGEHIRLGVELLKEGEAAEEISVSDVSFVLDDSNIIKPLDFEIKDNIYFVEFEALKAGTAFVTFSDAVTGFAAKVPVTAYDKSKTSFTLDSIVNFVNGYYLKDVASVSGIFADNYSYTVDEKTGKATVKFDAYNSSYIYGAVEVYDANGNLTDAVVLDKYESGATSLKEIFIDNPLHVYKGFVEGNYFSDTFYRAETYSKKTSVSVIIPKGGYITITTDAYSSDIVSIANCIDMLLQVKDVAGDIKGYREESSKFIKLTTEKAVEKIIKDGIKPKSIAQKLAKGFSKEFLMTKNSMGDFMDSVVNNINTLDIATFAIETAKGFAFGVGEEVAIALTGPGYKEVIKTLLTVGKITEIGNQYLDFVNSMDCGTISIHNQEGSSRTSENVTVKCETSFDNDVALKVFNVVPESDLLDTIKAKEPELYKAMMKDLSQVYNISMIKNGEETQPEQEVQVYIPLDPELLPYTGMGEVKVYRVEEDGSLTDMKAKLEGEFMMFTTDHFSLYVLAVEGVEDTDPTEPDASEPTQPEGSTTTEPDMSEPVQSEPESSEPTDSIPTEPESSIPTEPEITYLSGDANGDGKINVKDATQIQKAAASLVTLDDVQTLASDANGDGKVNVKDATAIQKFVAGIPVSFPIGEERKK